MVPRKDILDFTRRVAEKFKPAKIILFGSHASGKANKDSDVDLMVVMRHRGLSSDIATRIRTACPRKFPMDLIVRSPAQLRRRIEMGDDFLQEIVEKGVILHEADHT